jgi:small basic protein (TIGR04137 family)
MTEENERGYIIFHNGARHVAHRTIREVHRMSRHPSFGGSGKVKVKRNVLKRFERVDILKSKQKFKEGDSPLGLPKTKIVE